MTLVLVEVSSVVLANAHNPSILNHDWLVANRVLPDVEGGWEFVEPPFTTPPLSTMQYQNNVRISLEPVRLTITAQTLGTRAVASPEKVVSTVAGSYVSILEHIPYVAVGNNFKVMIECDGAQSKLIEAFGGSGPWRRGLASLSAKLSHKIGDGCERHVEVAAVVGQKFEQDVSTQVDALLLAANYHRNSPSKDLTLCAIAHAPSDLQDFLEFGTDLDEHING